MQDPFVYLLEEPVELDAPLFCQPVSREDGMAFITNWLTHDEAVALAPWAFALVEGRPLPELTAPNPESLLSLKAATVRGQPPASQTLLVASLWDYLAIAVHGAVFPEGEAAIQ